MRSWRLFLVLAACALAMTWALAASGAPAVVGAATATELPGTPVLFEANWDTVLDLPALGYTQTEYVVDGTATAYTSASPLTSDGQWTITPSSSAPFRTRMIVRRPTNPKHSNGVVYFEWLNVSNGFDWDPDWSQAHEEMIRDGYTWVGVSAQRVGVTDLVNRFPGRYGTLTQPSDSFSYDIFSQVGALFRAPGAGDRFLGGAPVKTLIAGGHSQSAVRMTTYANAFQPRDHVFDAIMIHGRFRTGAPLSQAPQPVIPTGDPQMIRTDLDVPVMTLEAETELPDFYTARQPDSPLFRLWEVPGISHNDAYQAQYFTISGCTNQINSGPHHYVFEAALEGLREWAQTGHAPASEPRVSVLTASPFTLDRDADGNARGGVRTPQLDVPIATLTGFNTPPSCNLFGSTFPFTQARLAELYPTHGVYVSKVAHALTRAVGEGVILRSDAPEIQGTAAASSVGK